MCGIIGYVGPRECRDLLLEGLRRLEYRGYDSAGVSLLGDDEIGSVHAVGNLQKLRDAVAAGATAHLRRRRTGIGHTRWATHGRVTEANAHPHSDTSDRVHIVLNGIVENWTELRERLEADGAEFTSETDAEVVAHLIAQHLNGDLTEAVRQAYNELRGHYAFVAMSADHPGVLVGARKECPLVVGARRGRELHRLRDPRLPRRDAQRPARQRRRDRRDHRRRARASSSRSTGSRSSARSRRSTGTTRPPRRAATRPSC